MMEFSGMVSRQAVWYGSRWVCSRWAEGQGWRSVGPWTLVTREYLTNSRSAGLGCAGWLEEEDEGEGYLQARRWMVGDIVTVKAMHTYDCSLLSCADAYSSSCCDEFLHGRPASQRKRALRRFASPVQGSVQLPGEATPHCNNHYLPCFCLSPVLTGNLANHSTLMSCESFLTS